MPVCKVYSADGVSVGGGGGAAHHGGHHHGVVHSGHGGDGASGKGAIPWDPAERETEERHRSQGATSLREDDREWIDVGGMLLTSCLFYDREKFPGIKTYW